MSGLGILWLLLLVPLILFIGSCPSSNPSRSDHGLPAFLALSSCLGNGFRSRYGFSLDPREGIYDRTYFRTMTNTGPAASEHIELESMLGESDR